MAAGEIITHNALSDVSDWSGPNFWTERMFPASNLATGSPGLVARWKPETFGSSTIIMAWEFKKQDISRVAILNANISSAPDLALRLAPTMDLLLDGVGATIPIPPSRWKDGSAYQAFIREVGMGAAALVGGQTTKTIGSRPLQIGSVWLGRPTILPSSMQWGEERGEDFIGGYMETEYGVPIAYPLSRRRVFRGALRRGLTLEESDSLGAIYRQVRGRARPILFVPDGDRVGVIQGRLGSDSFRTRTLTPSRMDAIDLAVLEDPWGETGA